MKIAFALLSAFLVVQQPETSPGATGVIRGTVVNLLTGAPLANATVNLHAGPDSSLTATADRDGKFEFNKLTPRTGSISVTLLGFNHPDNRRRLISLGTGEQLEYRIGLVPAVAISGKVLDDNKQPVSRAVVQLAQKGYLPDGSQTLFGGKGFAVSDESGEFRISNVTPGDYAVVATRDDVLTYYPGVQFPDQAVTIPISGTDVAGIHFPLVAVSRYAIHFRLSGVTPVPKDISVQLPNRVPGVPSAPPFKTLPTTENGIYTFPDINPGSYRLMIHWYEEQPAGAPVKPVARMAQSIPFDIVDRDVDLGAIEIEQRSSIDGRITFKGIEPFPVNIVLAPPPGQVMSTPSSHGLIGENNTFSISEIPEGRYSVHTGSLPGNVYLASAVHNGTEVLGKEITIEGFGIKDGKLDIVLDSPAGGVSGVVRDAKGDPFADATVVLLPPADRREGIQSTLTTTTDKDGKFSLIRVRPGSYTLFAWENIPEYAYRNAEWLKLYETRGTRVTVAKGATANVNLRLIPQQK